MTVRSHPSRRALAVVLAGALTLAACGGDDDDDTTDAAASDDASTDEGEGTDDGAAETATEDLDCSATLVVGPTGLGDQSFADSAHAGILRAEEELGVDISVVESAADTDVEINLSDAAADGSDVSFAIGFQYVDAVTFAAEDNPDSLFGIVDAAVEADNVASLLFSEPQGSFLAGVVAASMSESGTIGFVGGLEIPLIEGFWAGYSAGAMSVNPDIRVLDNYAGAWDDPGRGKEIALAQYGDGADVVFHAAGGTGLGVFEAVNEVGGDNWVIGVDADQYDLSPDHTLTSMMKRVDVAVFDTIQAACEGTFEAGVATFGLEDGGVGLAESTSNNTPQDVIDLAAEYEERIAAGEITVPVNADELASFEPAG